MDSDLNRPLFDSARDHYDRGGRWTFLTVIILLVFHITTFHPFISASRGLKNARAETDELKALEPKLQALRESLDDLAGTSKRRIDAVVKDLLDAELNDFKTLNGRVQLLRGEQPPEERPSNIAVQTVQAGSGPGVSDLPPLNPELAERVRQGRPEQIRQLLRDYINTDIIERRFAGANRQLQQVIAPDIARRVQTLQPRVAELAKERPQWQDHWSTLQAALTQTAEAAQALVLAPPADRDWWFSAGGKIQTLGELGRELVAKLETQGLPAASDRLQDALNQTLARQAALQGELQKQIDEIAKQFEEQQKQVRTLGEPFKWVALDLTVAASRFPLLLGLVLAALSLGASHRMRELALALNLLSEPNPTLWTWYFQRTVGGAFSTTAGTTPGRIFLVGLPDLLAALAWVTVAAWQVAGWMEQAHTTVAVLLLLSWAALLVAYGYRQRVVREAIRFSEAAGSAQT